MMYYKSVLRYMAVYLLFFIPNCDLSCSNENYYGYNNGNDDIFCAMMNAVLLFVKYSVIVFILITIADMCLMHRERLNAHFLNPKSHAIILTSYALILLLLMIIVMIFDKNILDAFIDNNKNILSDQNTVLILMISFMLIVISMCIKTPKLEEFNFDIN